ncbi:MAG: ATP-binding protein [Methanobrevibacter sp. CfCl-M3]
MDLINGLLENILYQQKKTNLKINKIKKFNHRIEYFKIEDHLNSFIKNKSNERFIVIPGLRGLGKSTIFYQLYSYLVNKKEIPSKNVLYISMDEIMNHFETDLLLIVENYLKDKHKTDIAHLDEKIFIFIDECHLDEKWAISGKIIYDSNENIFLIATGSSAINLEINADVARRIKKEPIFPLNFNEYLSLKYDISIDYSFSKILSKMIYFGDKKSVVDAVNCESTVYENLLSLENNPKIEFETFLKSYGFPLSLENDEEESYEKIITVIESIIEKDLPSIKPYFTPTKKNIWKIIDYLALQKPGGTSIQKIANYLSFSANSVNEILNTLEKSQLIFNVKPHGGPGKIVKKPWQYYFLSSSLKSAINFRLGRYKLSNRKCMGLLAENMVASALYKITQTNFKAMGLFYPPLKGSSDFLINTKFFDFIPIEVGIGKKTKSQVKKDMEYYNSDYGILVSNRFSTIKYENNIIYIPLMNFGFI